MFFENTQRDVEDELAEIDLSKCSMYLGPLLPGEEIIGEMNDFEKRAFIWNSLMLEKMKEVIGAAKNYSAEVENLLNSEIEVIVAKLKLLEIKVVKSLLERFDTKSPIAFRGNFQIVLSKQSKQDRDADIKKLWEVTLLELQSMTEKTHAQGN